MPATESRISVDVLWDLALPPGTTLQGGEQGLSRRVEWVAALRASFPMFAELAEGYLALARLDVARSLDPNLTPGVLIQELAGAQAAALVVDEPLSPHDAALADEVGLPVLLVPAGTDLRQLERDILRTLVDREGQLARREMEARRCLQQAYDRRGVQGVADALAGLVCGDVTIADAQGRLLAKASERSEESALVPTSLERAECPIHASGRALGNLLVATPRGRRQALDALYTRQAAEVCAVDMLQQLARQETEERLGADLVEQLLDTQSDTGALAARLSRLGYPLASGKRHVALALWQESDVPEHHEAIARDLVAAMHHANAHVLRVVYRTYTLFLCAAEVSTTDRGLRGWLSAVAGQPCCLGVSRLTTELAGLRQAVRQAIDAADLGRRLRDHLGPHYYDDLGLYRLLAGLRGPANEYAHSEVERFFDETLGALVCYDRDHGTEFTHTLAVFFAENANTTQAAKSLYVHRNTLIYRLQRIMEITGLDVNDPEARLALQVALKIHALA